MALLGQAALAMWWDMAPDMRHEFEDWHSHEHFRERLGLPGFRRASRWADAEGGEGFFQIYELEAYETLSSPAYLARLNAPTPWSTKMMPHHRNMVRCQCRVLESSGSLLGRHLLTLCLSPAAGRETVLLEALRAAIGGLVDRAGFVGAHLLRHDAPAIAATTEQRIRGGDRAADWIFLVAGYERVALEALATDMLSAAALMQHGAAAGILTGLYTLSFSAVPAELA